MIDSEEVRTLAGLARLSLSENQIESYRKDFEGILDYIATINSVDLVKGNTTEAHVVKNVVREDDDSQQPGEYTEKLLEQAPRSRGTYFEVPKIL